MENFVSQNTMEHNETSVQVTFSILSYSQTGNKIVYEKFIICMQFQNDSFSSRNSKRRTVLKWTAKVWKKCLFSACLIANLVKAHKMSSCLGVDEFLCILWRVFFRSAFKIDVLLIVFILRKYLKPFGNCKVFVKTTIFIKIIHPMKRSFLNNSNLISWPYDNI